VRRDQALEVVVGQAPVDAVIEQCGRGIKISPDQGRRGWSFCSRLTAIHADTGGAWAASIRPGMGQFVASVSRQKF
jgi:hypothetical protein